MKKLHVALVTSTVTAALSIILSFVWVTVNDGFGISDIFPFAILSFFHSVYVSILALIINRGAWRWSTAYKAVSYVLIGLCASVPFTISIAILPMGTIQGYSFPVFYIWMIAGGFGMMVACKLLPRAQSPEFSENTRINKSVKWVVFEFILYFVGTPIVIVVSLFVLSMAMLVGEAAIWTDWEQETFLIPAGYTGPVLVIFDCVNGEPPKYESGRRLYEINNSGVLKTQFSTNTGWHGGSDQFYYVDQEGRRRNLSVSSLKVSERNADTIAVFLRKSSGRVGTGGSDKELQFTQLIIGTHGQSDTMSGIWDDLTSDMLRDADNNNTSHQHFNNEL